MCEYIIESEFVVENKLNNESVIDLLIECLNTNSDSNCLVSIDIINYYLSHK